VLTAIGKLCGCVWLLVSYVFTIFGNLCGCGYRGFCRPGME